MSKTRLREELERRNPTLLQDVEHQVGMATPQLWHTYATFPSGTKHTPEHTRQVEEIAGLLINDDLLAELTDYEIGLLILACHFHDLGMSGTEEDNRTEESRDQVRREHAVSIGQRISEHWLDFGFPSETFADILAEICKGHRPKRTNGIANWDNLARHRIAGPGNDVRVRVVAALVYAADELHIGDDRAPRREEEFHRIESALARQHWRRHQAVQGPSGRGGDVCFEGTVSTPLFEKDLRVALLKAFKAVRELNEQLAAEQIRNRSNRIYFSWHRKKLWTLMVTRVCADLVARSEEEIIEDVLSAFCDLLGNHAKISTVCFEDDSRQSKVSQLSAAIDDLRLRGFLRVEDAKILLSRDAKAARHFFDLAKSADEAELHLIDAGKAQHEAVLYQSAFGKRYIREQLAPHLEAKYSVDLSSEGAATHTKTALESSPTAARIAELIQPPDTVLVQNDLFQFACISGICGDLISNPELILDKHYRQAVDTLVATAVQRLPEFLLFVKELAIIKGLGHQQVIDATSIPDQSSLRQGMDETGAPVSFTLTQQLPQDRPEWSIGHLLLARARANLTIAIKNTDRAPFRIAEPHENKSERKEDALGDPRYIVIGPGKPTIARECSFRGTLELDDRSRKVLLRLHSLSKDDSCKPVLVRCTVKPKGLSEFKFSFIPTEMTVGDSHILSQVSSLLNDEGYAVEFAIDGEPVANVDKFKVEGAKLTPLESRLLQVSPSCASPLFIPNGDAEEILAADPVSLKSTVDNLISRNREKRPTVTTLSLRFTNGEGRDYFEEDLGIAPLSFGFNPPTVSGEGVSQADVDHQWHAGTMDLSIESTFREESWELAQYLREWAGDVSKPFPIEFGNDVKFHFCKTRLSITFCPIRDRQWYRERRVIFRLRPVSQAERYGVELDYWRSRGDTARAELLDELFQDAAARETARAKQNQQRTEITGANSKRPSEDAPLGATDPQT